MPTSERDLVPARVERLLVLKDGGYVVLGTDEKALLIVIGPAEAGALARARRGERQERPLTHELLVRMLGASM